MKNRLTDIREQYKTSSNLSKRISLHEKYSTNKTGYGNWIFSHYEIFPHADILELGAGTGDMWIGRTDTLPEGVKLTLMDLSAGMLETCKANVGNKESVLYEIADAENIPYADRTFDLVIANAMLYHVLNIDRGISEIARVLKEDGVFYCATYGENGIIQFLTKMFHEYGVEDMTNKRFILQNGEKMLRKHFSCVERYDYEDSLAIEDADDLCDYVYSLTGMTDLTEKIPREDMRRTFESKMENGVLNVPKEYGMFICRSRYA